MEAVASLEVLNRIIASFIDHIRLKVSNKERFRWIVILAVYQATFTYSVAINQDSNNTNDSWFSVK